MNKSDVIKQIQEKLNIEEEKANKINDIIEDTFLIGNKNKEKMIERFQKELETDEESANKIYETVMSILGNELVERLKHPFKDLDKTKN